MEPEQYKKPLTEPCKPETEGGASSPEGVKGDITSDEAKQAEYRKAYLEQLRQMSCPGCGEDPTLPY